LLSPWPSPCLQWAAARRGPPTSTVESTLFATTSSWVTAAQYAREWIPGVGASRYRTDDIRRRGWREGNADTRTERCATRRDRGPSDARSLRDPDRPDVVRAVRLRSQGLPRQRHRGGGADACHGA